MCDIGSIFKSQPVDNTTTICWNSRLADAQFKPTCSNGLNPQSWWRVNVRKLLAMTQGNMNVNLEVYLKQDCVSSCIITSYHNINTFGVDVTCDFQTIDRYWTAIKSFKRYQKENRFFSIFEKHPRQSKGSNFVQPRSPKITPIATNVPTRGASSLSLGSDSSCTSNPLGISIRWDDLQYVGHIPFLSHWKQQEMQCLNKFLICNLQEESIHCCNSSLAKSVTCWIFQFVWSFLQGKNKTKSRRKLGREHNELVIITSWVFATRLLFVTLCKCSKNNWLEEFTWRLSEQNEFVIFLIEKTTFLLLISSQCFLKKTKNAIIWILSTKRGGQFWQHA